MPSRPKRKNIFEGIQKSLGSNVREARAVYDFAANGGAVGDIVLSSQLPPGAVILTGFVDVLTAPTSGGAATVALKVEGAADILAATAIGSLTLGRKSIIPNGAGVNAVKTTVARNITVTVATAALTAGRFVVSLWYVV